jgi:hypothetical protein
LRPSRSWRIHRCDRTQTGGRSVAAPKSQLTKSVAQLVGKPSINGGRLTARAETGETPSFLGRLSA